MADNSVDGGDRIVPSLGNCTRDRIGNRYFPGTLAFDDLAVADEAFVPLYARLDHLTREGGNATDDAFTVSFLRLLTPTIGIDGDETWLRRSRDGFSTPCRA